MKIFPVAIVVTVAILALGGVAVYAHAQTDKHTARVHALESAAARADDAVAAYHKLEALTEQFRANGNREANATNTAWTNTHNGPMTGFCSVMSDHVDRLAQALRVDDIARYVQAHGELVKVNDTLTPLQARSDEFSDQAHVVTAILRGYIANPFAEAAEMNGTKNIWEPYIRARNAEYAAFRKYYPAVYALGAQAEARSSAAHKQVQGAQNQTLFAYVTNP